MLGAFAARAQPLPGWNAVPAPRSTRVYLFRGLGGELVSSGIDDIGERIQRRDPRTFVSVEDWYEWEDILRDAFAHPADRIVIVGYSMGSRSAGLAANELARGGIDVKVIGIDPLCADPSVDVSPHIRAVNYYMTSCVVGGGRMAGARNVKVGSGSPLGVFTVLGHAQFPSLSAVQRVVVDEVFRDDFAGSRGRSAAHARGVAATPPRIRRPG